MKAERRHELKENDLLHAVDVVKGYLDRNGKQIAMGVIVVAVVVATVAFTVRSKTAAIEDVWRRKAQLRFDDPETGLESLASLKALTEESDNPGFLLSALIQRGNQALRLANEVPSPPDKAFNDIARSAFEELLTRMPDNALAFGLAHTGLASVAENDFALDGDPAHKGTSLVHLNAVIENSAMSGLPFHRIALDRRDAIDEVFVSVTFVSTAPEVIEEITNKPIVTEIPLNFGPILPPEKQSVAPEDAESSGSTDSEKATDSNKDDGSNDESKSDPPSPEQPSP